MLICQIIAEANFYLLSLKQDVVNKKKEKRMRKNDVRTKLVIK